MCEGVERTRRPSKAARNDSRNVPVYSQLRARSTGRSQKRRTTCFTSGKKGAKPNGYINDEEMAFTRRLLFFKSSGWHINPEVVIEDAAGRQNYVPMMGSKLLAQKVIKRASKLGILVYIGINNSPTNH